jgi:hypothetical protein
MVMTEIMYDVPGTDSGREWVEVRNVGSDPVDLSTWKLFEANVNHKLSAVGGGTVPPGGFAVIADSPEKFLADNVGFSGMVFDSAFSLTGDGEVLILRDSSGTDVDSVSYDTSVGAKGDGFSLQKTSDGRWITAVPTAGSMTVATQSSSAPIGEDTVDDVVVSQLGATPVSISQDIQATSAHSSQVMANTSADVSDLEVTSGRTRLGVVDTAIDFRARIRKGGSATTTVDHAWSMGDGFMEYGPVVDHTYRLPGTYSVVLNSSTKYSRAVSRVTVRVLDPQMSVVGVTDQYVEVGNRSALELNLGGWSLQTEGDRFIIADDTIIAPGGSIKFAFAGIPRFSPPREFVRVVSPLGRVFAEWNVSVNLPDGMTAEMFERIIRSALNHHE